MNEEDVTELDSEMSTETPEPRLGGVLVSANLKRRLSDASLDLQKDTRKRAKAPADEGPSSFCNNHTSDNEGDPPVDGKALSDDLAQELQCGCCSELVYRPVVVSPCQHFFCGSCCVLWIRNGGTNCPGCRGASTIVTPSRPLQSMIDVLLRAAPGKARTSRERIQADDVYKAGTSLRIPTPRETSPDANQNGEYARPCPHCLPGNPFGWRCPLPIADPNLDAERAWRWDEGPPPGHALCGNCENILAIGAPSTTKCDLCQVSFCGINVPGRCVAASLSTQYPHGMLEIEDLIQSQDVYECFEQNAYEVEVLLDYLKSQRLTPTHIYREIVAYIQKQPGGFTSLIELDLFVDVHGVAAGVDPDPTAPRNRICRLCATEVLFWGLREWWVRERPKGLLPENVLSRQDCPEGQGCGRQKDLAHAQEFNHIIAPLPEGLPQVAEQVALPPSETSIANLPSDTSLASNGDAEAGSEEGLLAHVLLQLHPSSSNPVPHLHPPANSNP